MTKSDKPLEKAFLAAVQKSLQKGKSSSSHVLKATVVTCSKLVVGVVRSAR